MKLLDFNPFGKVTDSLLFSWDELMNNSLQASENQPISSKIEFRLVETDLGIHSNQYSVYSQPRDTLDSILDTDHLSDLINQVILPEIYR